MNFSNCSFVFNTPNTHNSLTNYTSFQTGLECDGEVYGIQLGLDNDYRYSHFNGYTFGVMNRNNSCSGVCIGLLKNDFQELNGYGAGVYQSVGSANAAMVGGINSVRGTANGAFAGFLTEADEINGANLSVATVTDGDMNGINSGVAFISENGNVNALSTSIFIFSQKEQNGAIFSVISVCGSDTNSLFVGGGRHVAGDSRSASLALIDTSRGSQYGVHFNVITDAMYDQYVVFGGGVLYSRKGNQGGAVVGLGAVAEEGDQDGFFAAFAGNVAKKGDQDGAFFAGGTNSAGGNQDGFHSALTNFAGENESTNCDAYDNTVSGVQIGVLYNSQLAASDDSLGLGLISYSTPLYGYALGTTEFVECEKSENNSSNNFYSSSK